MISPPKSNASFEDASLDQFVASLTPQEQKAILAELESQWIPLPHQEPPSERFRLWALIAGRGSGKTDADAAYVNEHAMGPACIDGPAPHRIGVIAPTHDDAKNTCVVGESGLLQHNAELKFTPGGKYGDLIWPSGSVGNLFGAFTPEDVERLRGPQHCLVWAEELASWRFLEQCWDMMQFGLRLGDHPHAVASSTPKVRPEFWKILDTETGTIIRTATTDDNPFLHPSVREQLYSKYGGTRLGRQELLAERLTDIPGALWSPGMFGYKDAPLHRVGGDYKPDHARTVVAIDPAVTYGPDSDETGIVVAAKGADGRGYVLDDVSGRYSPREWAVRARGVYAEFNADAIVAEVNNGGDMVEHTLRNSGFSGRVITVHATKGKRLRAEPIAALYEQGKVSHARPFPELEDQLCTFTPESTASPDRLDALVWALTELFESPSAGRPESFSIAA